MNNILQTIKNYKFTIGSILTLSLIYFNISILKFSTKMKIFNKIYYIGKGN